MMMTQNQEVKRRYVRSSYLNYYKTCPRMFYYREVEKLAPKVENPKLTFGKGLDLGINEYYLSKSLDHAIMAYNKWLKETTERIMAESTAPDPMAHIEESAKLGEVLLREYIAFAKQNDDFDVISMQQEFEVPVFTAYDDMLRVPCLDCYGSGRKTKDKHVDVLDLFTAGNCPECNGYGYLEVWLRGTMDGLTKDIYGVIRIMENKTARDFPSELDLQLNMQNGYYVLAAQQLFDEDVSGTVYNVIRKQNPAKARKAIIFRRKLNLNPHQVRKFGELLYNTAEACLTTSVFDINPGFHCNWMCAYRELCLCDKEGIDRTDLVKHYFRVKEDEYDQRDDSETEQSD